MVNNRHIYDTLHKAELKAYFDKVLPKYRGRLVVPTVVLNKDGTRNVE
jgi:hypothetical protein